MKSSIILILLAISIAVQGQPTAKYTPWYAPSLYRNLEKYWWYRYRLVNDFMKMGTGCGESIPMSMWQFSRSENGNDETNWGDAPQHLGNYINTLAGEWYILNKAGLSTNRTEEELFDALFAFERLDKKAEPTWRAYDLVYPYCGGNTPFDAKVQPCLACSVFVPTSNFLFRNAPICPLMNSK